MSRALCERDVLTSAPPAPPARDPMRDMYSVQVVSVDGFVRRTDFADAEDLTATVTRLRGVTGERVRFALFGNESTAHTYSFRQLTEWAEAS